MDETRRRRAHELLIAAKELVADERASFLEEACGDDRELRKAVESGALDDLAIDLLDDLAAAMVPERIGPFRIVHEIGRGGMGVVYLAEQDEPIRRRVAVKLVKWGMDTESVIARFESERQALALMEHPSIAKIFEAGATPDGRPYFAMEYVPGIPITEHCDRSKLTNGERLELFLQVCEGVQHAHQKAVIHRDLKPSNVLVSIQDDRAVVKIIDFGLAKALAQRLTEQTLYTDLGVMIGTPEYMSPEQAARTGQDVDTRSDVYSLGVMLYELLVGALPFERRELQQAGFDEILRKIREDDPPRPSVRVSTAKERSIESARRRRTDPRAFYRGLRGDLDWITMRALEKDRTRRYGSPSELAEDLRRHLRFEPVLAHAPSTGYRARRFVRRHRLAVTAASVMVLGLAAGTIGATLGVVRARRAEAQAHRDAEAKAQVARFMTNLFRVSNPSEALGNSITARELLDKGAASIDTQLADEPEVRAELQATMGDSYRELGLYEPAASLTEKALELRKRVLGLESPTTLGTMNNLAVLYEYQGRHADAERLGSETLEIRNRVLGPEHPDTIQSKNNLAVVYVSLGRYADAERLDSEVFTTLERVLGAEHPDTVKSMNNLANVYQSTGRNAEATRLYADALELRRRVLGPLHPDTLESMHDLAGMYTLQGRDSEAEQLFTDVIDARKHVLGPTHPNTLLSMNNLAIVYKHEGRYPEAERLLIEVLETTKRSLGPDSDATINAMDALAGLYARQDRYVEAERLYTSVLEAQKRSLGPEHPDTLGDAYNLAALYMNEGRPAEAEPLLTSTLEAQERKLGLAHPDTLLTANGLFALYQSQRRYAEAERILSRMVEAQTRTLGSQHPDTLVSTYNLACIRALRGDRAEAMDLLRRIVDAGYRDPDLAEDRDLSVLHGPEFDALVAKVRGNAGAANASASAKPRATTASTASGSEPSR